MGIFHSYVKLPEGTRNTNLSWENRWLPVQMASRRILSTPGPPRHFPLTTWLASRQDVWRAARDASETKNGEFNQPKGGSYHQQQDLTSKNHDLAIKHGDLSNNNWDLTNKNEGFSYQK